MHVDQATCVWLDLLYPGGAIPDLVPAAAPATSAELPDPSLFAAGPGAPHLLERLPPESVRGPLLDALDGVLRLHSALHFPHLRARLVSRAPPTWNFLALAAAAWALGAQAWLVGALRNERVETPWPYDPDALLTLSEHLSIVAERSGGGDDVDYVYALLFQAIFRLNDGLPRCQPAVYPILSKAVSTARAIGLGVDPTERMSLFEAEARRRCWWDVVYFDVCVGFA